MSNIPLPTDAEREALLDLFRAFQRLKALGWHEAMYAPRDNRELRLIEVGSTGIHVGSRGKEGDFWIHDGDTWPSTPCLYKDPTTKQKGGEA